MSGENTSANMNMPVPGVGVTSGPTYATDLNNCLTIIDGHDHSAGNGVKITPSGLNISSDLSFLSNNATALRSVRLSTQTAVLALTADLACLYNVSGDLYYNDGVGNNVRITQSGGVAGSPGSISSLTSPASASYVSASDTFVWQSNTTTAANMDAGSYKMRNISAGSNAVTIAPPASIPSDYTITMPNLPAASSVMTLSTSGAISTTPVNFLMPTGSVIAFAGASAPSGYIICDGSAISRSAYADLFAAVGTTFGVGDGSSTFNIPDLRGIFVRGAGTNGTLTTASGGAMSTTLGAYNNDSFQAHQHTAGAYTTAGGPLDATGGTGGSFEVLTTASTVASGGSGTPRTSGETRPANLGLNYIIKT
jgi:microcystin-dependent protein